MTAELATYQMLAQRWKGLRSTHDVRVREVACVGAPRTLLCAEYGDHGKSTILLAAGVHGDEPAGPHALLELIEHRMLDSRFAYRIWACTNPTGFDARTRESIDGIDINRTFGRGGGSPESRAIVTANRDHKFELSIDLHEDDEASGFYCYEYGETGAGAAALRSARELGVPIDPRELLRPDPRAEAEEIGGLSLSLLLCRNASARALTLETAAAGAFSERIAAFVAATRAAILSLP
jgi:murein peptide amidase A